MGRIEIRDVVGKKDKGISAREAKVSSHRLVPEKQEKEKPAEKPDKEQQSEKKVEKPRFRVG